MARNELATNIDSRTWCTSGDAAIWAGSGQVAPGGARGFTLVDLLIAMGVVAILTAIAVPSYQSYVMQSRRSDAKTGLLDLAAREERFLSLNPTSYTNVAANLSYPAFPVNLGTAATPDYQLSVVNANATSYLLQAVPQGGQVSDTCGTYTLDNLGNQLNIFPAGNPAQVIVGCW